MGFVEQAWFAGLLTRFKLHLAYVVRCYLLCQKTIPRLVAGGEYYSHDFVRGRDPLQDLE